MAEDRLERDIDYGVEDGRPRGNWRQNEQEGDHFAGNLASVQGAHEKDSWRNVRDSSIAPPIHKGCNPDEPSIGEVIRCRRKS